MQNLRKNKQSGLARRSMTEGFTLLEILLVVAAIAILAGIVIFAINPSKQLADTRNAQRRIDVNTILNAVLQYKIDHNGGLPAESTGYVISATEYYICPTFYSEQGNCEGMVDLLDLTDNQKYIVSIPFDPSVPDVSNTGYKIKLNAATGRITVSAPLAEDDVVISVTN